MLRIETQTTPHRIEMTLQGDLSGVEVCEFLQAWREARRSLAGRAITVDLSDVVRVDKAGEFLLALVRCHGTRLTGSGLVIGSLLESIAGDWPAVALSSHNEVSSGR